MTRPPINVDLIRSRSADLRRELEVLEAYARISEADFLGSGEKTRAARYSLIVVVEAAAAVCNHLAARLGRSPESYPECFEALSALGVVDAQLGRRLVELARFRNILVHGYGRIDDQRLHGFLRNDLSDIETYLSAVTEYLRTVEGLTL